MLQSVVDLTQERKRLLSHAKQYLDALVAHDLRRIRFSADLRNTENTIALPLGTGLSRTITMLRQGGHYFVDVHTGQVEYWGAVEESGEAAIFGVRLKVAGLTIAEVETVAVRGKGDYFVPDVVISDMPAMHEVIPAQDRATTRAELIEAAQRYFDGIEQQNGAIVPATDDCVRLVNGAEDTNADVSGMAATDSHRAMPVRAQITAGPYSYIEALRSRRYPILDEERGLVMAHVLFDHPGDRKRSDGMLPFKSPNTMLIYEVFKVRAGLIEQVWAIGGALPYGIGSGWPEEPPRLIAQ